MIYLSITKYKEELNMEIDVKVRQVELGKVKGFADVVLDGKFMVKGLKIIEGVNSKFVAMPNVKLAKPYKDKDGKEVLYQDIFFPISKESRQELIDAVLGAYNTVDDFPF